MDVAGILWAAHSHRMGAKSSAWLPVAPALAAPSHLILILTLSKKKRKHIKHDEDGEYGGKKEKDMQLRSMV